MTAPKIGIKKITIVHNAIAKLFFSFFILIISALIINIMYKETKTENNVELIKSIIFLCFMWFTYHFLWAKLQKNQC